MNSSSGGLEGQPPTKLEEQSRMFQLHIKNDNHQANAIRCKLTFHNINPMCAPPTSSNPASLIRRIACLISPPSGPPSGSHINNHDDWAMGPPIKHKPFKKATSDQLNKLRRRNSWRRRAFHEACFYTNFGFTFKSSAPPTTL